MILHTVLKIQFTPHPQIQDEPNRVFTISAKLCRLCQNDVITRGEANDGRGAEGREGGGGGASSTLSYRTVAPRRGATRFFRLEA